MDEDKVREHANAHGQAVAAGDLRTASGDLTEEGRNAAGSVMPKLPRPVTRAEVLSVEESGERYVARIRYEGEDSSAVVESYWEDKDGKPMIVDMKVE